MKLVGQSLKILEIMQTWAGEVPELVGGRDEFQRWGRGLVRISMAWKSTAC